MSGNILYEKQGAVRLITINRPDRMNSLDFAANDALVEAFREFEGLAVLLVEQLALLALDIADDAYVLQRGKVALSGPARELRSDPAVVESYLG